MRVTTWTLGMLLLIFAFTSQAQAIMVTEDSPVWVDFTLPIVAPFSLPASNLSQTVHFSRLDFLNNASGPGLLNPGEGIEVSVFDAFGNLLGSYRYINDNFFNIGECSCTDVHLNPPLTTPSGHMIIRAINGSFNLTDVVVWDGHVFSTLTLGTFSRIVVIDIQPESIDLSSRKPVQVAILSSAGFDATDVVPATVHFAGASVGLGADQSSCKARDVNSDGVLDLLCGVKTSDAMQAGQPLVVLEAMTFSGERIRGAESITVVP